MSKRTSSDLDTNSTTVSNNLEYYRVHHLKFQPLEKAQATFFSEKWVFLGCDEDDSCCLQVAKMTRFYTTVDKDDGYYISQRNMALIFGLSDGAFYRRIKQGNKLLAGLPTTPTGRPPLFTYDQIEIIWQEVKRRDDIHEP